MKKVRSFLADRCWSGRGVGVWRWSSRVRNESLYRTVSVVDDVGRPRDADGSAGLWPGQKRSESAPVAGSARS